MYLITFHSQFDSNIFVRKMKSCGSVRQKPVPRQLSSSCGTCCTFEPNDDSFEEESLQALEFEKVYLISGETKNPEYELIFEKE